MAGNYSVLLYMIENNLQVLVEIQAHFFLHIKREMTFIMDMYK